MGIILKIFSIIKNLSLPSFLNPKILIPAIGVILSSVFGAGLYTQNQIDRVLFAQMEQKYVLEITQLKNHIVDLEKITQESNDNSQQVVLLLTYNQYLLSVSDFYTNRTQLNIDKSNLYKERFINYLKAYSGKQDVDQIAFFDVDGVLINVKFFKLKLPEVKKD